LIFGSLLLSDCIDDEDFNIGTSDHYVKFTNIQNPLDFSQKEDGNLSIAHIGIGGISIAEVLISGDEITRRTLDQPYFDSFHQNPASFTDPGFSGIRLLYSGDFESHIYLAQYDLDGILVNRNTFDSFNLADTFYPNTYGYSNYFIYDIDNIIILLSNFPEFPLINQIAWLDESKGAKFITNLPDTAGFTMYPRTLITDDTGMSYVIMDAYNNSVDTEIAYKIDLNGDIVDYFFLPLDEIYLVRPNPGYILMAGYDKNFQQQVISLDYSFQLLWSAPILGNLQQIDFVGGIDGGGAIVMGRNYSDSGEESYVIFIVVEDGTIKVNRVLSMPNFEIFPVSAMKIQDGGYIVLLDSNPFALIYKLDENGEF